MLKLIWWVVIGLFRSRASLDAEIVALRHQLNVGALFLASQGVPLTLADPVNANTLEGATQIIARGPIASQEASKLLSGDGGGFFNANSAHPYENPTALTNLFEMLLIFLIGAGLTNTFCRMVGDERQGWSLLGAMMVLFAVGLCVVYSAEASGNPHFAKLGIDQAAGPLQAGGNMEGKEVRFGICRFRAFCKCHHGLRGRRRQCHA